MEQVITENHNHLMELLGVIFNWCSWILYLLIDKYKRQRQDKKRDKVRETV